MSGSPSAGEHRKRLAKIALGDGRKLVDARRSEEALERADAAVARVGSSSPALPGTTPPMNSTLTDSLPARRVALGLERRDRRRRGMVLSGMSRIVVTPPAAAARVAVAKPSHSVRPGSLTWTCVSTRPGITTAFARVDRVARRSGRRPTSDTRDDAAVRRRGPTRRAVPCGVTTRRPRMTSVSRRPLGLAPEAPQQIRRHAQPILRRRAQVVDRRDLRAQNARRVVDRGAARERRARSLATRTTVGATLPNAMRGAGARTPAMTILEIACAARVPTLRNHCVAFDRRDLDRDDQLVGSQHRRAIAGVELVNGTRRSAVGAAQHDDRVGRREHRQRVARRRGVRDVAAERAAILDLRPADCRDASTSIGRPPGDERRPDERRCTSPARR